MTTVTYLDKVIRQGQVQPMRAKVQTIDQFQIPSFIRDLMQLLGMAGLSTSFLSPEVEFKWTPVCENAFPHMNKSFYL